MSAKKTKKAKEAKETKKVNKEKDDGLIRFKINGQAVQAREGWTILETARQNGIQHPHPLLPSGGGSHRVLPSLRGGNSAK